MLNFDKYCHLIALKILQILSKTMKKISCCLKSVVFLSISYYNIQSLFNHQIKLNSKSWKYFQSTIIQILRDHKTIKKDHKKSLICIGKNKRIFREKSAKIWEEGRKKKVRFKLLKRALALQAN